MENVLSCIAMAAITFPVCFLVARGCLRGLLRLMAGRPPAEPRKTLLDS